MPPTLGLSVLRHFCAGQRQPYRPVGASGSDEVRLPVSLAVKSGELRPPPHATPPQPTPPPQVGLWEEGRATCRRATKENRGPSSMQQAAIPQENAGQ